MRIEEIFRFTLRAGCLSSARRDIQMDTLTSQCDLARKRARHAVRALCGDPDQDEFKLERPGAYSAVRVPQSRERRPLRAHTLVEPGDDLEKVECRMKALSVPNQLTPDYDFIRLIFGQRSVPGLGKHPLAPLGAYPSEDLLGIIAPTLASSAAVLDLV